MRKTLIIAGFLALTATAASAQYNSYGSGYGTGSNPNSHPVQPYTTSSGTYVQGHQATNPNNTQMDNYSTRGNVNPYTGAVGTRTPRN